MQKPIHSDLYLPTTSMHNRDGSTRDIALCVHQDFDDPLSILINEEGMAELDFDQPVEPKRLSLIRRFASNDR
jgi:hypothetical protein